MTVRAKMGRRVVLAHAVWGATAALAWRAWARPAWSTTAPVARPAPARHLQGPLRSRVRGDFADGRVVIVDGWVLSRTEADLAGASSAAWEAA